MTTNYDRRPIAGRDAWLLDTTGRVIGVETPQGRKQKSYMPGLGDDVSADASTLSTTGTTVSVSESSAAVRKTRFTLASTPLTLTDDAEYIKPKARVY